MSESADNLNKIITCMTINYPVIRLYCSLQFNIILDYGLDNAPPKVMCWLLFLHCISPKHSWNSLMKSLESSNNESSFLIIVQTMQLLHLLVVFPTNLTHVVSHWYPLGCIWVTRHLTWFTNLWNYCKSPSNV